MFYDEAQERKKNKQTEKLRQKIVKAQKTDKLLDVYHLLDALTRGDKYE